MIENAESHIDKMLIWQKKKKEDLDAKRIEDERLNEQKDLGMMQNKPKISEYKGTN